MKGQGAYATERGKGFATRANDMDQAELAAQKSLSALSVMENQMKNPNFYSGFGAPQVQTLKSVATSLGGDPSQVQSMETFGAVAKQVALDAMGGSLGSGFSNADRDFVTGQVPSLDNTPQGNKSLIDVTRKVQQRKIDVARMARNYEQQHGQIDSNFFDELSTWAEQNPMFKGTPLPGGTPSSGTGKTSNGVPWKVLQ